MQKQMKINVDPNTLKNITCPNDGCESVLFIQSIQLKQLSGIQSPTGMDMIINIPGPQVCLGCGKVVDMKQPEKTKPKIISN